MRIRAALLPCATVVVALLLGPTTTAHANQFRVECASSHVSKDDPIVFPGQRGAAHRHEFFGARSTNFRSTTASLQRSRTSCASRRDTAAYWIPTLELRGRLVRGHMTAYYQRAGKRQAAAPPRGLRVVAGSMHAHHPQSMRVTSWQCIGRGRATQFRLLPACRTGERLGSWVRFPDCWDGRRLDSPDHKSHLRYSVRGACAKTHPVAIMRVATLVTWPIRPQRRADVTLAGGRLTPIGMHGDFWNAWHQPTLEQLRWDCIEMPAACGAVRR